MIISNEWSGDRRREEHKSCRWLSIHWRLWQTMLLAKLSLEKNKLSKYFLQGSETGVKWQEHTSKQGRLRETWSYGAFPWPSFRRCPPVVLPDRFSKVPITAVQPRPQATKRIEKNSIDIPSTFPFLVLMPGNSTVQMASLSSTLKIVQVLHFTCVCHPLSFLHVGSKLTCLQPLSRKGDSL